MKSAVKIVALVIYSLVLLSFTSFAQDNPQTMATTDKVAQLPKAATVEAKAPELTKEQTLVLDNAIKDVTIAQQAIQIAVTQRDAAVKAAGEIIQSLQVPGYDFDYQTKTYTKKK